MSTSKSYTGRWIVFAIALFSVPCLLFLITAGNITGEEFSPDDFSRRKFSYNVMPIFGIVIQGIEYDDTTPVFEQTLYADGFLGKSPKEKKWHLLWDSNSDVRSPDFDARLLTNYLDIESSSQSNSSIWMAWNEDHPSFAIELWPVIAELAREQLYLDVAEILNQTISLDKEYDNLAFKTFLWNHACNSLNQKASHLRDSGELEESVRLYSLSIDIDPNHEAYLGRSNVYLELGKNVESERDSISAANFKSK